MSQHVLCDTCGEVIDQSTSYYTGSIQSVQMIDGVLTSGGSSQVDYHTDHLPGGVVVNLQAPKTE